MATVGNLFVNIKGDASHLNKTVNQSKRKLSAFQSAAGIGGQMKGLEANKQRLAALQMKRSQTPSMLHRWTVDQGAHKVANPAMVAMRAKEGQIKGQISAGGKAVDAAKMRMFMGAAFATLGVTAAAAGMVIRKASSVQAETEDDFATFTARGAMLKTAKLMDRIAYVNRPDVQREQAQISEDDRYNAARSREVFGDLGAEVRTVGQVFQEFSNDVGGALMGTGRPAQSGDF
tara:strand:- start:7904 stop:8599 length:696 start_codon:yes stop_codon:yes gene_type:complete